MKKWVLLTFFGLFSVGLSAFGKVESVQLDYVGLDPSVDCNRILFSSSQHFKGTIFYMPRIVPGKGVEAGRTYNILPTNQRGIYNLLVSFYFPSNDEPIKNYGASTNKRDLSACNWDRVKYDLNSRISDPDLQIKSFNPIPLTSIEVQIFGIASVGKIGRDLETNEEADILDYNGKVLTASFKITEHEKTNFESQLVTDGIPTSVRFRFQARSRNGFVRAQINSESLAENFSAAATAQGLKYLGSAEIAATFKGMNLKNSVQITSAGNNENISKITDQLLSKTLDEVKLALPTIQLEEKDQAKAGSGQIALAALLKILKSKMGGEFNVNLISSPESASAQTEIRLRAERTNDPNIIEVQVTAGFIDPSLGLSLNKDETIAIAPAYTYTEQVKYKEFNEYITESDIKILKLGPIFEDLMNENVSVRDTIINGTALAQGRLIAFPSINQFNPFRLRWKRSRQFAVRSRLESGIISPKIDSLNKLQVFLTFSALGDTRFVRLADFLVSEDNEFWSSFYDQYTGQLYITAKQDLGIIRIRERLRDKKEDLKYSEVPIILDQVYQQTVNSLTGSTESGPGYILAQDDKAIVLQKTIGFNVTRPRVLKPNEKRQVRQTVQLFQKINQTTTKVPAKP